MLKNHTWFFLIFFIPKYSNFDFFFLFFFFKLYVKNFIKLRQTIRGTSKKKLYEELGLESLHLRC